MTKTIPLLMLSAIFVLASFSLASAYMIYSYPYDYGYGYGGYRDGYYDSYHSNNVRSSGYYGGPASSRSTNYDRLSTSRYLPDGTYEQRTSYTRTTRDSPGYGYGYGRYDGYPRYNYYDSYPWYQRYWQQPTYSYPRTYYQYNYYPYY